METKEKHALIFEKTGIESRHTVEAGCLLHIDRHYLPTDVSNQDLSPHYPESQLWEMLPFDLIGNDWVYTLAKELDLHTALLGWVLWCIEEGYIKCQD